MPKQDSGGANPGERRADNPGSAAEAAPPVAPAAGAIVPERREPGPDRRAKPTNPFIVHSVLHGQRRKIRREEDREVHYYVDRYGPVSAALFLLALVMSTADALITIRLVRAGGSELNPVMNFLLQFGAWPFLIVKFLSTFLALLFLLIHKEYGFLGGRIRGKHLLGCVLAIYAALIFYEFTLLGQL